MRNFRTSSLLKRGVRGYGNFSMTYVPAVKTTLSEFLQHDDQNIARNRNIALKFIPALEDLIASDDPKDKELIASIDRGVSKSSNELKKYFDNAPWVTRGFLSRIRGAKSIEEIKFLGNALASDLTDENGNFDEKSFNLRVSDLPTGESVQNFWNIINSIKDWRISPVQVGRFIVNSKNLWDRMSVSDLTRDVFYKYAHAITEDIVMPVYYSYLQEEYKKEGKEIPEVLMMYNESETRRIREEARDLVVDKIFSILNPRSLVGYSNRMERNLSAIEGNKTILCQQRENLAQMGKETKHEWHPIIESGDYNGYKIKVLTTQQELEEEASEMQNCVKNFGRFCNQGITHILSGCSPNGERFTFKLSGNFLEQLYGVKNTEVSKEVKGFVGELISKMQRGIIKRNERFGSVSTDMKLEEAVGFDVFDKEEREKVFKSYCSTRILPKDFVGLDYDRFFDVTGLAEALKQKVKSDKLKFDKMPKTDFQAKSAKKLQKRMLSHVMES